ncbi:MAG: YDG domain-containing protein, partial [Ruthenibacterium sp.]
KLGDATVVNGKATLIVKTADKKIDVGKNQTVTAVYSGSADMNGETATCTVTVESKLTGFTFTSTENLQEGKPNTAAGAVAGEFSVASGKAPFTYALVKGDGANDADNGSFTVSGTKLNIGSAALKEKVYHVFAKVTDVAGQTLDKAITISVTTREDIKGTIAIAGTAAYGETLTAKTTGVQASAMLHYVWKSGAEIVGTDSTTYTIGKTDMDKTITVTASDANYKGELTAAPTAKVQKKAITATAAVSDKIYDGKTDATVNFTFKDNVATDTVTATATAAFSSKDVGEKIAVTLTDFKLDAVSALYYTCTAPSGLTGNITPKTIEVTAGTLKIEKEYDGTTAFTKANASGELTLDGVFAGDVVRTTILKYGDAPNKNAGEQKITLTLATDSANYTLKNTTYPDFAAKITQKPLKDAMFKAIAAQTYAGSEINPAIVIADSESTLLTGNDFTVTYANNIHVGTAATANIAAKTSGNYSGNAAQKFTINKADTALTVQPGKNSYAVNEDITFTASVTVKGTSAVAQAGTVTFYLGTESGTKLGDATVVNGKATLIVKTADKKIDV